MEHRRFGRTGHLSTIAIFGAAAFWDVTQAEADATMEQVLAAGVNHIDVAPSYGQAEERLGPWLERERARVFLGCKTTERTAEGALAELRRSLKLLRVESFDLYQIHAVTSMEELDAATRPGGALDTLKRAKEEGLTRYLGLTGHGVDSPTIFLEALRRFDFDSVLFPLNFVQYANPAFRASAEELIRVCRQRDVGTMVIKAITKGPWGERPKTHATWYEPMTAPDEIQTAINFALSQDITGLCTSGDIRLVPPFLQACQNFQPQARAAQEALIASASHYQPLFA